MLLMLLPCVTHAVGLGRLTVVSTLGQPLSAEIELVSVGKDEAGSLTARLAPVEAYTQAKLTFSPALVGARASIEKRADGRLYIRIVSARAVNDPFIELMVEVTWAQGKLTREYTALIDPPEFVAAAPAAPAAIVSPPAVTAQPIAPESGPRVRGPAKRPADGAVAADARGGNQYGPIRRGETLIGIAAATRPEGVTLEQMLVSLYRSNPQAFLGNMNRLRAGAILRVPDKEQITELTPPNAAREVRVQAANWNAYRQRVADTAPGVTLPDSSGRAGGKISTRVDDKAKPASGEVLRLSKGDPPGAGKATSARPQSPAARARMLEEESIARDKALADANDRIVQLEKTLKEMQAKVELKGQPPLKGSTTAPAMPSGAIPPQAVPTDPSKPPAAVVPKATLSAPGTAPPAPAGSPAITEPGKGEVTPQKAEPSPPLPKPKPKIVEAPPAPTSDLLDDILGEPLAAIALLLLALGGGGYVLSRRRRKSESLKDLLGEKTAPKLGKGAAESATSSAASATGGTSQDTDPLAEADLYLNFGRDAQAEEVLKEVLVKNPTNEEAQLKLLRIYAGRKEKAPFEKTAKILYGQTKGSGDNWLTAAALGYGFDPDNPLYEVGRSAPAPVAAATQPATTDLDFDLELAPSAPAPAMKPATPSAEELLAKPATAKPAALAEAVRQEEIMSSRDLSPPLDVGTVPKTAFPEFSLPADDVATPASAPATVDGPVTTSLGNVLDFNLDAIETTPRSSESKAPPPTLPTTTPAAPPENQPGDLSIDFELPDFNQATKPTTAPAASAADTGKGATTAQPGGAFELKLDDIDLDLNASGATAPKAPEGGVKDDHWYDVQTKFDLAKAYQEMGDKHGMREILEEVVKEGDAGQQEEAKKLLATLT